MTWLAAAMETWPKNWYSVAGDASATGGAFTNICWGPNVPSRAFGSNPRRATARIRTARTVEVLVRGLVGIEVQRSCVVHSVVSQTTFRMRWCLMKLRMSAMEIAVSTVVCAGSMPL
jgi:hypothetical protein